jgi:hypothetical protein
MLRSHRFSFRPATGCERGRKQTLERGLGMWVGLCAWEEKENNKGRVSKHPLLGFRLLFNTLDYRLTLHFISLPLPASSLPMPAASVGCWGCWKEELWLETMPVLALSVGKAHILALLLGAAGDPTGRREKEQVSDPHRPCCASYIICFTFAQILTRSMRTLTSTGCVSVGLSGTCFHLELLVLFVLLVCGPQWVSKSLGAVTSNPLNFAVLVS